VSVTTWRSRRLPDGRRPEARCAIARTAGELARHFAVRRAVFVDEQALFAGDDRDAVDDSAATLHAVGRVDGRIGGAVRLYPLDAAGLWQGDRLAVLPALRHGLLGAALVRFAVARAGALGGRRMVAMIQLPNVAFFQALGWVLDGPTRRYHGVEHQPMAIALSPRARSAARPPGPRPEP
jgi:putative N-acetyltransferase (TIGR04045 family)